MPARATVGPDIRIIQFNNKGYPAMSQDDVRDGFVKVRDAKPDLVGIQESWKHRYTVAFQNVFGATYGYNIPRGRIASGGCLVAWRENKFSHRRDGSTPLHGVVPFVCSWRWITFSILVSKDPKPQAIGFASVHFTPGAHTHRYGRVRRGLARRAWYAGMRRLLGWAARNIRNGTTRLCIVGDFNAHEDVVRAALPSHVIGQPVRLVSSGILHFILIGRWEHDEITQITGVKSDHNPQVLIARAR